MSATTGGGHPISDGRPEPTVGPSTPSGAEPFWPWDEGYGETCCNRAYLCNGEMECAVHGGFDVCCDRPDLHRPVTAQPDDDTEETE